MDKRPSVDDYITQSPPAAQDYATQVRAVIKQAAPEAQEKLSYGIPYYDYHGRLIYWGAYKQHLALYVMTDARQALADQIKPYHKSKATLHFPLDQPLPNELINKIVRVQAAANKSRAQAK